VQPLLFFFAQDPIECFPKKRSWQLAAEFNVPRDFIWSQVSPAMFHEVFFGNFIRGWNDDRLDRLTPIPRQHANDRGFPHLRVKQQYLLDLRGIDIEA
jgi:hypothetical protein